jgi:hypothetical protein
MGEPQPEPGATAVASAQPTSAPTAAVASSDPAPTVTAAPEAPAPKAIKTISLSEQKLALSIDLPEDAKLEESRSKDKLGGAMIDALNIDLRVMKADARLATIPAAKASLQKMVRPAKSFHKEEKDLLVYDRGGDDREFVLLVKVAGVTYSCQGRAASEALLEPGITACRSLKKSP